MKRTLASSTPSLVLFSASHAEADVSKEPSAALRETFFGMVELTCKLADLQFLVSKLQFFIGRFGRLEFPPPCVHNPNANAAENAKPFCVLCGEKTGKPVHDVSKT